jgi:hypothetical protein
MVTGAPAAAAEAEAALEADPLGAAAELEAAALGAAAEAADPDVAAADGAVDAPPPPEHALSNRATAPIIVNDLQRVVTTRPPLPSRGARVPGSA